MFLETITLVKILPCLAEPGRIIVIGQPSQLLTDVIPYLATLPDVIVYNPATCTVTFRRQHGFMTLYADKVTSRKSRMLTKDWNCSKHLQAQSTRLGCIALNLWRSPLRGALPACWISGLSFRKPIADSAARLLAWRLRQRYYTKKDRYQNACL